MTANATLRSISVSALADGAADGPLLDQRGRVSEPLVAVDLDTSWAAADRAARMARSGERILVGVRAGADGRPPRELLAALDLTLTAEHAVAGRECAGSLDPAGDVLALHAAATANPQAALALRDVLRFGDLDVRTAIAVESFAYSTLLGGAEFARWLDRRGNRPLPSPSPHAPVLVDRAGDRLSITLNRPERRNAYGRELRDALVDALRLAVLDDSIRRVVLTGAGPSFSSGGDLDEFGTAPDLATAHFVRTLAGAGRMLHRLADRTAVLVHGSCVGAGIELPAFAGRVVAHPDTTFRLPEVGMGLIPGAGGTVSLPRRIGRWRTLLMALSGSPVDAATALDWGLVDAVGESPNPPVEPR